MLRCSAHVCSLQFKWNMKTYKDNEAMTSIALSLILCLIIAWFLVLWGTRWGSTPAERARIISGDEYLDDAELPRVIMTRAISISAPPERVWPWIAQLGRGAGWYSVDWLDNGKRASARHIVSWIPEPRLGDATAIGYLRHIDTGHSLVWWLDGGNFLGSRARLLTSFSISAEGEGARVISRISSDAAGVMAPVALLAFRVIDSIMAVRQLVGLRERVEYCEHHPEGVRDPETAERAQYQFYEIIYASGGSAGVPGEEEGAKWREAAVRDGVLKS